MQTAIAILLVTLCGTITLWKIVKTLRGAGSMGSCCSKGCGGQTADQAKAGKAQPVHFVPLSALKRR